MEPDDQQLSEIHADRTIEPNKLKERYKKSARMGTFFVCPASRPGMTIVIILMTFITNNR